MPAPASPAVMDGVALSPLTRRNAVLDTQSGPAGDSAMTSLNQGLRILSAVQESGAVRVKDLGESLDLPASTLYRYLRPLERAGYILRVEGHLLPGERLASAESSSDNLTDIAAPILKRLRDQTRLSALLTVRIHSIGVCLYRVAAHPSHRLSLQRGNVQPLYAGASVTPLLAYAPAHVVDAALSGPVKRFTAATPGLSETRRLLPTIRSNRYAATFGELTPGMGAIGVPVFVGGECVCVISLVGEGAVLTDLEPLLAVLRSAVAQLETRLERLAVEGGWQFGDDHDR